MSSERQLGDTYCVHGLLFNYAAKREFCILGGHLCICKPCYMSTASTLLWASPLFSDSRSAPCPGQCKKNWHGERKVEDLLTIQALIKHTWWSHEYGWLSAHGQERGQMAQWHLLEHGPGDGSRNILFWVHSWFCKQFSKQTSEL